ncbi:MAG: family transcriptional regulator [Frankiales bacterium]|nr:family transcriptional regulator [Frankiales bacterium]
MTKNSTSRRHGSTDGTATDGTATDGTATDGMATGGNTDGASGTTDDMAATHELSASMRLRSRAVLADYIRLLGLSERGFARRAGLSHSTVNHLIAGRRLTCASDTALAIERALGCPPGLLFISTGPPMFR